MISVIIPLYNKEPIIERTIRSVLSQDYDDFEIVVVDDGSTDRSADIVRSIDDPRIRLIEQENGGPSKARNTGVKNANGEWIVFLDADDELLAGALKRFAEESERHPNADFIACPFYNDNGEERVLQFDYKERYIVNPFKENFFNTFLPRTGAFICKKHLLIENPFNEAIRRFEDIDVLFRIYHTAKIYVFSTPSMVVNQEFASASHGRKDISEDFVGHLDFNGKSFWERMSLYKLFLGERPYYLEQCKTLYPSLHGYSVYYFLYQVLVRLKSIWV